MINNIFLLLGSNQGTPIQNLIRARNLLIAEVGEIVKASSFYKTAAWGIHEQPDFFNQVLMLNTTLKASEVLEKILRIEADMGRIRRQKWGPRLIDIDILFYNDSIINTSSLIVPHPGIPDRRFVLIPLCEIEPTLNHPQLKKSVAALLEECDDALLVEKVSTPSQFNT